MNHPLTPTLHRRTFGFTLVEVLASVTIIGILIFLAIGLGLLARRRR